MPQIYHNGLVFTGELPLQQAFKVDGGLFAAVGSNEEILALRREGDEVIDLKGSFVCAGFIDSHMHVLNYGYAMSCCNLIPHTTSLAEVQDALRAFIDQKGIAPGVWVRGRGWNHDYFADGAEIPTRWDLDRVSCEHPICIVRCCGHCLVLNSFALELLGIDGSAPQPDGGHYDLDEHGVPTGVFRDSAMSMVYPRLPQPTQQDVKDMILIACRLLNSYGVTSAHTDDLCAFEGLPWQEVVAAYHELEAEGKLTVRIYEQSQLTTLHALQDFIAQGYNTGVGSSMFRIGPLKMLGDGALGARTAYLSRPYADAPETCGIPVFSQETFDEMIGYAHANGMQTAIHAIGDACLDRVLSAMEKALAAHPRSDHRHGIVHCQITRPEQLETMARMGLHIYAQSIFLDYDLQILESRLAPELLCSSYSWKSLKDRGATVSNGTDCPVELPFALGGIQCAVTRQDRAGRRAPYLPGEAFSVQEALDSYTSAGAYASFEETCKGKIAPGMLADFVVLGENPFAVCPSQLQAIPVLATYVGGRLVYAAEK